MNLSALWNIFAMRPRWSPTTSTNPVECLPKPTDCQQVVMQEVTTTASRSVRRRYCGRTTSWRSTTTGDASSSWR